MKRAIAGTRLTARERLIPENTEELHALFQQVGRPTFMERLATYAADARAESRKHGLPENEKHAPGFAHDTAAGYAVEILRLVNSITAAVERDIATPDALRWAFELGVLIQESRFKFKHEESTRQGAEVRIGQKEGGKAKKKAAAPRHRRMIAEYRDKAKGRYTATELMTEIGKKHGLGRSQSIEVLRDTEQKIRNRGKSDE